MTLAILFFKVKGSYDYHSLKVSCTFYGTVEALRDRIACPLDPIKANRNPMHRATFGLLKRRSDEFPRLSITHAGTI